MAFQVNSVEFRSWAQVYFVALRFARNNGTLLNNQASNMEFRCWAHYLEGRTGYVTGMILYLIWQRILYLRCALACQRRWSNFLSVMRWIIVFESFRTVVVTLCKIEPVSSQIWISYPFSLRQGVFRGTHFHTNETNQQT